jgi:hypothetical protein
MSWFGMSRPLYTQRTPIHGLPTRSALPGHLGTRGYQCGYGNRHGAHGFRADGDHQRPGAYRLYRTGRLPGMRHGGNYATLREAQLPGQGCQGSGDNPEEGLLHREDRASRPGIGRYSQGHHQPEVRVRVSQDDCHAVLQPGGQGTWRPDQESGADAAGCQAADDLCRRRGDPVGCLGKTGQTRAQARLSR